MKFSCCIQACPYSGIENAGSTRSVVGAAVASHELTARLRRQRQGSCSGEFPGRYWLFPTSTVESPNTYTAGTRCNSSLWPAAAATAAEICTPALRTNATTSIVTFSLIIAPAGRL
uniref:Uncharacterized protein n=1 Tax=Oryza meridionalis TaxID=40149 RepID=A0A0E0CR98_9ORYZ